MRRTLLLLGFAFAAPFLPACGGHAEAPVTPAAPGEQAPLPPLATTPIALITEHRTDLALTSEQLAALDTIARNLADTNRPLEAEVAQMERESERMKEARGQGGGGRGGRGGGMGGRGGGMGGGGMGGGGMGGGGMGGGGMGGGGMGGGGMGGGGGRGGMKGGGGSGGDGAPSEEMRQRFRERREKMQQLQQKIGENNDAALGVALCSLAEGQREHARQVLTDDGYEVPAGLSCTAPSAPAPSAPGPSGRGTVAPAPQASIMRGPAALVPPTTNEAPTAGSRQIVDGARARLLTASRDLSTGLQAGVQSSSERGPAPQTPSGAAP